MPFEELALAELNVGAEESDKALFKPSVRTSVIVMLVRVTLPVFLTVMV